MTGHPWPVKLFLVLLKIGVLGGLFAFMAATGSLCYFEFAPPERTCLSCHELREPYDRWAASAHREVSCKRCHGGALTSGWHGMRENLARLVAHFRDEYHDNMRLRESQVVEMSKQCGRCHTQELVYWEGGGHGITYAEIFLNAAHNAKEQIAEDCLRCHGMFYEGPVADVVEPLAVQGPWKLKDPSLAKRPAVPCLACHQIHVAGHPFSGRSDRGPNTQPAQAAGDASRGTICLYSRRERTHFAATALPTPRIHDRGRPVTVSSDPRQRLCVQCHAPNAFGQAGSGDDRTPVGVHEGLSCAACHAAHSNDTKTSCAQCHPKFSHCGLDVTTMDTSFRARDSKHNIHFIRCESCHAQGVPKKAEKK